MNLVPRLLFLLLLATFFCCTNNSARAEEYNPKYSDVYKMRLGLFIHWVGARPGAGTGIVMPDGSRAANIDAYAKSFDVEKIADDLASLGFEYVVLTNFHGYGTLLHPSAASDKWRGPGFAAKRDLVGEFIDALRKRGIATILFTHPLAGNGYSKEGQEKLGWDDPAGNYKKWNDYINAVYAEMAEKYGDKILAMGFDSTFGLVQSHYTSDKVDLARLRKTIHDKAPQLPLLGLAAPNETCELGFKEIWRPTWHEPPKSLAEDDYDVEKWPVYRRAMGIVQANHWATITPAEKGLARCNGKQLYRYTVLQAAAATEGPGTAWAVSPYPDGSWEKNLREQFAELNVLMEPVRESLRRVYPSNSYRVPERTKLSTLPHGIAATQSLDGLAEYIHVLNPPGGKELQLPPPADGKQFTAATLLDGGMPIKLVQTADGVTLTLSDSQKWHALNTVIKLNVAPSSLPRRNLALHKQVNASSNLDGGTRRWPPRSDFGRIRLTDGRTVSTESPGPHSQGANYGFSSCRSAEDRTEWVQVDLAKECEVSEVVLHPRNRGKDSGYGFPGEYKLEGSLDGKQWSLLKEGKAPQQPTAPVVLSFPTQKCRYIRVTGSQLRTNPKYDNQRSLELLELEVYP